MKRRTLLAATIPLFALSGCSGVSSPSSTPSTSGSTTTAVESSSPTSTTDGSSTPDERSTTETSRETQQLSIGESATIGAGSATVFRVDAKRSIFVLDSSHHYDIVTEPNAQYLVTSMTTEGAVDGHRDVRASTELILDDERYPISEYYFPLASTGGFKVGYRVPLSIAPRSGRIVWNADGEPDPLAEWTLSGDALTRLNHPPSFDVVSFDVPDTAESFEPFDVSITVENTGEGDGTFRAELGMASYSDLGAYRLRAPVGERITDTDELQVSGVPGEQETIILDWGLDRIERTVEIVE